MISSEVQRTLVKSPPELWAELSDQATLARHLGELGEIRITRIDPEQVVEWEAEDISGTVLLKPSGWGTKVTLSVTRETPEPEAQAAPESPAEGEPLVQTEPGATVQAEPGATVQAEFDSTMHAAFEPGVHVEPEPFAQAPSEPAIHVEPEPFAQAPSEPAIHVEPEPFAQADPEPPFALEIEYQQVVAAEPAEAFDPEPARATRRSFLSKLFRRPPKEEAAEPEPRDPVATMEELPWLPESTESFTVVEQALEPAESVDEPYPAVGQTPEAAEMEAPEEIDEAVEAGVPVEPLPPAEAGAPVEADESAESTVVEPRDLSAELRAAERVATEQVTAVLTAVLDRLGAAHHRPFSRA